MTTPHEDEKSHSADPAPKGFEEWYAKMNEEWGGIPGKRCVYEDCWQAACAHTEARLLAARVVMPEKRTCAPRMYETSAWLVGYNAARDAIKLLPLSEKDLDALMPSEEEINEACRHVTTIDDDPEAFIEGVAWLREQMRKRLGTP